MGTVTDEKDVLSKSEAILAYSRSVVSQFGLRRRRVAAFHTGLKTKYERASFRPWAPVTADPSTR